MLWITTPYHSNLACINFIEPESYVLAVEQLPEGTGVLRVVDGKLIRDNSVPMESTSEPVTPETDATSAMYSELAEAYRQGVQSAYD